MNKAEELYAIAKANCQNNELTRVQREQEIIRQEIDNLCEKLLVSAERAAAEGKMYATQGCEGLLYYTEIYPRVKERLESMGFFIVGEHYQFVWEGHPSHTVYVFFSEKDLNEFMLRINASSCNGNGNHQMRR